MKHFLQWLSTSQYFFYVFDLLEEFMRFSHRGLHQQPSEIVSLIFILLYPVYIYHPTSSQNHRHFSQYTEGSLDETLLSAVSRRTLDQFSEIRETTICQRKSLFSTAQETNSDGTCNIPNALKHFYLKAEVFELKLLLEYCFCKPRRTMFVENWFWGC